MPRSTRNNMPRSITSKKVTGTCCRDVAGRFTRNSHDHAAHEEQEAATHSGTLVSQWLYQRMDLAARDREVPKHTLASEKLLCLSLSLCLSHVYR